ncbi:SDR family NAD(P)-dependent oxidoreductase [Zavarzinia sp. CC-PAN008]|uniref:SDR family NAD(P)-dependent oxidoreductase n=1 Tax=Zavarzinia sp. CC-PAN008 TaxID=3243332 RepID=UPI003F74AAB6
MIDGQLCVITGASAGIGAATALGLAAQGARLVLVARRIERLNSVAEQCRRAGAGRVDVLQADLSTLAGMTLAGRHLSERHARIDVLVNNAGGAFERRQETPDGLERTFALNHMAYFVVTRLLEVPLKAAQGRVVVVASEAHRGPQVALDDLQLRRAYSPVRAYQQSKLANILFARELARRWRADGVCVNALHPGFVNSEFASNNSGPLGLLFRSLKVFGLDPKRGARTSIHLATSPDMAGRTGGYYAKARPLRPSLQAEDGAAGEHLWHRSEEIAQAATV